MSKPIEPTIDAGVEDVDAKREKARLKLIALAESSPGRMRSGFKIDRDEMYGSPLKRHKNHQT